MKRAIQEDKLIYSMPEDVYELISNMFKQAESIGAEMTMNEIYVQLPTHLREKIEVTKE